MPRLPAYRESALHRFHPYTMENRAVPFTAERPEDNDYTFSIARQRRQRLDQALDRVEQSQQRGHSLPLVILELVFAAREIRRSSGESMGGRKA